MRASPPLSASLILVAATIAGAGCSSSANSSGSNGQYGGTVVITPNADASSLFPPLVSELTDHLVQDQVFDRLAEIDENLTTVGDKGFTPRLAKSWTWALDSMSIAFHIDPRARWHDGKPVTAKDVQYTFRAFTDPKVASPNASGLANIDSVSVRDSMTAVVWFKKRTPEQFYDIAYQLVIVPEHIYGSIPMDQLKSSPLIRTPIGTGRFRFVRWDPGTRIELVADTANFRGRPKLDRLIFAPAPPATASTQILVGQADFMEGFPIDRAAVLDTSSVARGMVLPTFGYTFMAMNRFAHKSTTTPHPIFSDIRVRRALSMAVNRVAMLDNVFGKAGHLSHGPFPMSVKFADSTLHMPPYDTTAAKAMLDSSGWRVGSDGMRSRGGAPLRFTILTPSISLFRQRYAVLMQAAFKQIGVQADIEQGDNQVVGAKTATGDFDAVLWTFSMDPSPSGVRQVWGTEGIASGVNLLRYSNKTVDAALDSAATSFDPKQTKRFTSRAFQKIIDDAPAIFLYDVTLVYAANRRITLAPTRPDEWWANLADWSIPADKRIDRDRIGLTTAQR